jgi:hypothetical protein
MYWISEGYFGIPSNQSNDNDKLIMSLRTAYAKELTLDKEQTSHDDSVHALRLSLKGYHIIQITTERTKVRLK